MLPRQALGQFKEFIRIFDEHGEHCLSAEVTREAVRVLEKLVIKEELEAAISNDRRCQCNDCLREVD